MTPKALRLNPSGTIARRALMMIHQSNSFRNDYSLAAGAHVREAQPTEREPA